MGSSSSGSVGNPGYLSAGSAPIPNLPIAGQGAPNDDPRNFGTYQSFLPDIPTTASGRHAEPATGLKSEMFAYKSPSATNPAIGNSGASSGGGGGVTSSGATSGASTGSSGGSSGASDPDAARAAAYAANPASAGPGAMRQQLASLQYGAARESQQGFGLYGQQSGTGFPINWTNSNNPNVTS
jgi:hypothetical protein